MSVSAQDYDRGKRVHGTDGIENERPVVFGHWHMAGKQEEVGKDLEQPAMRGDRSNSCLTFLRRLCCWQAAMTIR